jgi:hypothetical protein
MSKLISYPTENLPITKNNYIHVVLGTNKCVIWELRDTHKCNVWVKFIQSVPFATEPGIEDIATNFEQEYVRCVRNEEECVCSVCL